MNGMVKLIILRGNSGSGKTTIGKALQRKFGRDTMLISQDVVRREMLFVKDGPNPEASQLLLELALYGKRNCNIVIQYELNLRIKYWPLSESNNKDRNTRGKCR
jgi:adenylate kinase family enzyme